MSEHSETMPKSKNTQKFLDRVTRYGYFRKLGPLKQFLGPLELGNLFRPKSKVSCHEKSVFRNGVRFSEIQRRDTKFQDSQVHYPPT